MAVLLHAVVAVFGQFSFLSLLFVYAFRSQIFIIPYDRDGAYALTALLSN